MSRRKRPRRKYYRSEAWEEKRQAVIKRAGGLCEYCREEPINHIHHLTYERFGDEELQDLLGLCFNCHQRQHPKRDLSTRKRRRKRKRTHKNIPAWMWDYGDGNSGGGRPPFMSESQHQENKRLAATLSDAYSEKERTRQLRALQRRGWRRVQ
jgi:hypothetical protein